MDNLQPRLLPYNRTAAVQYARRWAYGRNPAFYDYEHIGGDCTNFASQCVYAGSGVMNYTKDLGWYYINANNKAPAWTGVAYFYNFMTRTAESVGPVAQAASIEQLLPGDVVQLSFDVSFDEAKKTYEMTLSNLTKANENLRQAQLGFKEGVLTTTDVIGAQTAWLSANSEKIDAEIGIRLCKTYLSKVLGNLYY